MPLSRVLATVGVIIGLFATPAYAQFEPTNWDVQSRRELINAARDHSDKTRHPIVYLFYEDAAFEASIKTAHASYVWRRFATEGEATVGMIVGLANIPVTRVQMVSEYFRPQAWGEAMYRSAQYRYEVDCEGTTPRTRILRTTLYARNGVSGDVVDAWTPDDQTFTRHTPDERSYGALIGEAICEGGVFYDPASPRAQARPQQQ